MGIKKSIKNVRTKDAIHAVLNALRKLLGSSTAAASSAICLSSSRTVGRLLFLSGFSFSVEVELVVGDTAGAALIARVVSQ